MTDLVCDICIITSKTLSIAGKSLSLAVECLEIVSDVIELVPKHARPKKPKVKKTKNIKRGWMLVSSPKMESYDPWVIV